MEEEEEEEAEEKDKESAREAYALLVGPLADISIGFCLCPLSSTFVLPHLCFLQQASQEEAADTLAINVGKDLPDRGCGVVHPSTREPKSSYGPPLVLCHLPQALAEEPVPGAGAAMRRVDHVVARDDPEHVDMGCGTISPLSPFGVEEQDPRAPSWRGAAHLLDNVVLDRAGIPSGEALR